MLNFVKKGAFMLFVASFAVAGLSSCDDDDPNYENVTPPTVEVAPNTLTGVIAGKDGSLIAGATVTLGSQTATTNAEGVFLFTEVKAGEYTIKAEAAKRVAVEGKLTVAESEQSQNLVWNAVLLSADSQKEVAVSATAETKAEMKAEAHKDNAKAEVKMEATVPAAAVANAKEDAKIVLAPIYDKKEVASRAADDELLIGTEVSCTDAKAKLVKPIALEYELDEAFAAVAQARKFVDGKWVAVESTKNGNKVTIMADDFASYGFFMNVEISTSDKNVPVSFSKNQWNNFYGSQAITAEDVTYNYKAGVEVNSKNVEVLGALLIERIAMEYGVGVSTIEATYPLGVILPVGTMLEITGAQQTRTITAKAGDVTVSATMYGNVAIKTHTSVNQHSGGTN